jgi:beta-alanine degradation protein BauB
MRHFNMIILGVVCFLITETSMANNQQSTRVPLLSNNEVKVWKTIIYPNKNQMLSMHRHEHNRVVVALDSGKLKIKNNKGKVHYLKLEQDKAYYLTKDIPGELHTDENVSGHPIKVVVIELNK